MRFLIGFLLAQVVSGVVVSYVCVYDVETQQERVVARLEAEGRWEAPNWTPDGKWLVLNSRGLLYRLEPQGGVPEKIETGAINKLNNDHGVSPDGKSLVISAGQMYVLPFAGGEPRQVTQLTPSYYHGWSPDGKTLAYCAKRGDNFDVFGIGVEGGEEKRLTAHVGYDDGPEYTPDGKWIWFNSDRAGTWDLWRMPASGAGDGDKLAQRMTSDAREDWFAHWSPNGKRMVFLSFVPGTKGHPANQTVQLRLWKGGGKSELLKEFFGGQGTINVNSWAPDSRRFAYVRYELR